MSLISELRANSRLRIGLALIISIVWLYGLLDLRDNNAALVDQYKQTALQLARFGGQQKQTQWPARADEAKEALSLAESRLWHNSTLGLAQAEMQDWLSQQLNQAKAVRYAVKVAESDAGPDQKSDKSGAAPSDLNQVKAKIEFNVDPKVLSSLLIAMANADHQIVVESMVVKHPRTELTVSAWYVLQPAVPSPQSSPSKRDNDKKN